MRRSVSEHAQPASNCKNEAKYVNGRQASKEARHVVVKKLIGHGVILECLKRTKLTKHGDVKTKMLSPFLYPNSRLHLTSAETLGQLRMSAKQSAKHSAKRSDEGQI